MTDISAKVTREMCEQAARQCACSNFRKVTRKLTQLYDDALTDLDIRSTQLIVLIYIRIHGPTATAALARELLMERSTLSRNLRPLIEKGLVTCHKTPTGRVQSVDISQAGMQLILDAVPHWQKAQQQVLDSLGQKRWEKILGDLDRVIEACE